MADDFLKKFVPEDGERYVFFENGKPVFVIMSFDDYQRRIKNLNQSNEKKEEEIDSEEEEDLTIDDLPV